MIKSILKLITRIMISFSRHFLTYEDDDHSSIIEKFVIDSSNNKRI